MKVLIWFLFAVSLFAYGYSQQDSRERMQKICGYAKVSFMELVSNPEKYHNKKVSVSGFMHVKFEDCALYSSKEYADFVMMENALWLCFSKDVKIEAGRVRGKPVVAKIQDLDCVYVCARGTFDSKQHGHMAGCFGALIVDEFVTETKFFDGKKELAK